MRRLSVITILLIFTLGAAQAQTPDSTAVGNDSITWSQELEGIVVKAQRQLIKQEIDRVGYDVQADKDSKTQTVFDMLRRVPMVTIDAEDNIKVKGNSSYKIYRNGHFDPSLSKNAKEILKALPASSVKRIEVITDPGAREDAEGVNAILNIVMMEGSKVDGLMGSLTAQYESSGSPFFSAYLATQVGKAVVSVDYGYSKMTERQTESEDLSENTFRESGNKEVSRSTGNSPGYLHYADINASYDIDTLNLISASFGGYFYKVNVKNDNTTQMLSPSGNQTYGYNAYSWLPNYSHHSWNGRLDYEHKTRRKGEQLTLSYMLALTRQHTEQETNISQTYNVPFDYTGYSRNLRENFTEHTFQADYVRPLWEGHKLEVGAKYIDRSNTSNTLQRFFGIATEDAAAFDHTTRIAAAYADYIFNHAQWSARAGLRYEYSYMRGHYPDASTDDFKKHLSDWVPQASVKYQIDASRSLKLTYTTSISRPGITYLNPAVQSSPSMVNYGNAHLSSNHQQSLSLMYMYIGRRLTLQLAPQYKWWNGGISSSMWAVGDVRYQTYDNIVRQRVWQIEGYAQWKPFDNTTVVGNVNAGHTHAFIHNTDLDQSGYGCFYYGYVSQMLPWKLLFTAYTFGQAGRSISSVYGYESHFNRYGFSLQRSFLKDDRLTLRLSASNPFHNRQHYRSFITKGDVTGCSDNLSRHSGRTFTIALTWSFGKMNASVKKTDATIENSDVVGGITKGKGSE